MKILSMLILLSAACCINLYGQQFVAVHPVETAINQDYREKQITLDEAILYKFYHLFDKSKLPAKYQTEQQTIAKCGTMIFVDYNNHKDKLNSKTISIIDSYINNQQRHTESIVYISPSGRFELTYDTTGTNAVPKADANGNGIADFVEKAALYCDYSWFVEIDSIGFTPPPINPPTTRYKISFEAMDYYGYTTYYGDNYGTRIALHNNYIGFPANDDPDGDQLGAMKVTIAHEFKHASQYKTSHWTENDWVEVDATWSEDIVYDATNDYYNYLNDAGSPFISPGSSLDGTGGGGSYEDCTWQHYMSQTHGNSIIRDYWTRRAVKLSSESVLNSYDSVLVYYGSSLANAFRNFTAWNYMSGSRAVTGYGYEEASHYPTSTLCRTHSVFPANGTQCQIDHLAANFIHLTSSGADSALKISFNGQNGAGMSLQLMKRFSNGSVELERITLDGNNDVTSPYAVRLENLQFIGLIPVVTQTSGTGFTYSYSISKSAVLTVNHTPLAAVQDSSGPYPVNAVIRSAGQSVDLPNSKIYFGVNAFTDSAQFSLTNGDSLYTANIPYMGNRIAVRYYLTVRDTGGYRVTLPAGAPTDYYQFSVGEDVIGPDINILSFNAIPIKQEFPLPVRAIISDYSGIDSVFLDVSKNSVYLDHILMTPLANDTFSCLIDIDSNSLSLGDTIQFSITANDLSVNHNAVVSSDKMIRVTKEFIIEKLISKSIPENNPNGVMDTLYLISGESSTNAVINDLDVVFAATHPLVGDLSVFLTAPGGLNKTIIMRPGSGTLGSTGDNPNIILDDEAATSIENITFSGTQVVTGTYKPHPDSLSSFDHMFISGMWIMKVSDNRNTNAGTWTKWGLKIRSVSNSVTVVSADDDNEQIVQSFALYQNYPNPFNPVTSIRYTIPERSKVQLTVYNILGQKVADIVNTTQSQGHYTVQWNGKDSHGSAVSSGVYFYRLKAGNNVTQKKMLLMK